MAKGGAQPGAGRPKGSKGKETIEREATRLALMQAIYENKKELADALVAKAKTGDVPALKEVYERSLGKIKESLDLTSGGDKLVGFDFISNHASKNSTNNKTGGCVGDSS